MVRQSRDCKRLRTVVSPVVSLDTAKRNVPGAHSVAPERFPILEDHCGPAVGIKSQQYKPMGDIWYQVKVV